MNGYAFNKRYRFFIVLIITTLLIFIPLYYSINSFFLSNADEIINSWYQAERSSIQQGNILSSISKLQRSINNSILLKGIVAKDDKGHELLRIGRAFEINSKMYSATDRLQNKKVSPASYIYYFSESGVTVYILITSDLVYTVTIGFASYLIILFFIFGYFVRRESTLLEKIRHERELESIKLKIEMDKKIIQIASQVAHDIRSPLAALNMAMEINTTIPSTDRTLINGALQRINDIANDLLQKGKQEGRLKSENIVSLIEQIVTEKRMQFREFANLTIAMNFGDNKNRFAKVITTEFNRVISNLINNSIEAFENHVGIITIGVKTDYDKVEISINDNGKGIPLEILKRLGEEGFTFGKDHKSKSGSGLGLFHAKKTIESFNGELLIESEINIGTLIKILLPLEHVTLAPATVESIHYDIILLDNDALVRMTWEMKAKRNNKKILSLASYFELKKHLDTIDKNTNFYIDVHLSDDEDGVQVAKELYDQGYHHLYLATGYEAEKFSHVTWIKGVVGKNPIV